MPGDEFVGKGFMGNDVCSRDLPEDWAMIGWRFAEFVLKVG